jgi:phage shock protein E
MINFFRKLFGGGKDYKALITRGALIIDVRTGPEFDRGHIRSAVNIPVERVAARAAEFKQKGKPVICCCQSGMRSGAAVATLKRAGVEAYNGGNWQSLERKLG